MFLCCPHFSSCWGLENRDYRKITYEKLKPVSLVQILLRARSHWPYIPCSSTLEPQSPFHSTNVSMSITCSVTDWTVDMSWRMREQSVKMQLQIEKIWCESRMKLSEWFLLWYTTYLLLNTSFSLGTAHENGNTPFHGNEGTAITQWIQGVVLAFKMPKSQNRWASVGWALQTSLRPGCPNAQLIGSTVITMVPGTKAHIKVIGVNGQGCFGCC